MEDKLKFTFEIKSPANIVESDLNSLIIRIHKLKHFYDINLPEQFEIKEHNKNIKEIKKILDNFIIEIWGE